ESAWSRGRRDRALERSATRFRDIGPLPLGAPVEEGAIGKVLADSLEGRGGATGVGVARVPGGTVVFDIYERIESYTPTFEQVPARHILVSPSGPGEEADRAARAKAEELLRRIRAGEDIANLARQYTDDPATKAQGGDLGYFARGTMLDAFERAAFTLEVGEVSEPVKTEVGY